MNKMHISPDDLISLNQAPRLKELTLNKVCGLTADDLEFLAAPKLISFTASNRAHDESAFALLAKKTQLVTFKYPVAELRQLAQCTKLTVLRVDGSQQLDFDAIAHLQIGSIDVHLAPDEATAKAVIERARETWPGMLSTGYRQNWAAPQRDRRR